MRAALPKQASGVRSRTPDVGGESLAVAVAVLVAVAVAVAVLVAVLVAVGAGGVRRSDIAPVGLGRAVYILHLPESTPACAAYLRERFLGGGFR